MFRRFRICMPKPGCNFQNTASTTNQPPLMTSEKPLIHCGTDILKIVVVLVFWTPHILLMDCILTHSTNFQYLVMIISSSRALNPRVRCAFCNVFSQSCWSWFNCFSFQDDIALLVCIILIMALTVFVVIIKVVIIITIICTRPKPVRKS